MKSFLRYCRNLIQRSQQKKSEPSPPEIPVKVGEQRARDLPGYDESICAGDLVPAVQATVQGWSCKPFCMGSDRSAIVPVFFIGF